MRLILAALLSLYNLAASANVLSVTDDFNRADESLVGGAVGWVQESNIDYRFDLVSNEAQLFTNGKFGVAAIHYPTATNTTSQYARITLANVYANEFAGGAVRMDGAGTFYNLSVSSGLVGIEKYVAGSYTTINGGTGQYDNTVTNTAGDVFELRVTTVGATVELRAYKNDALITSLGTSGVLVDSAGDRITTGYVGMFGLSIDGTNTFRVDNFAAGDIGPEGSGEDESLGQIGPYSAIDLDTYDIYTIDMADTSYEMFSGFAGGATFTKHTSGWPIGDGGYVTMQPDSATDGETSVGVALGTVGTGIQVLNIRYQARWGETTPEKVEAAPDPFTKHTLVHFTNTADNCGVGAGFCRVVYPVASVTTADNPQYNRADTLTMAPSANTAWQFGTSTVDDIGNTSYVNGPQALYWKDGTGDASTSFQGVSLIPADEVVEIEIRIQAIGQPGYPDGLIAFRVYRSNGDVFERGVPWTYDGWALGETFNDVQMLGCGQWNNGVPGAATFEVGRYITVARDLNAWLGASEELLAQ